MTETRYIPQSVAREIRDDGTVYLRSNVALGPVAASTSECLHRWAEAAPDRVFLAERSGEGWREVTYAEARQVVRCLAASLLERGMGPGTPILFDVAVFLVATTP